MMSFYSQAIKALVTQSQAARLLFWTCLLNAFDGAFSTGMVYHFGLGTEVNPLMQRLMLHGLGQFLVVKLVLVSVLATWLYRRKEPLAVRGLQLLALVYGLVVLVEVYLLCEAFP